MADDKTTPVELLFDEQTVDQEDAPDLEALGLLDAEPKGEVDEYEGKLEEKLAAEEEGADEPEPEAEEDAAAEETEDSVEEAPEEEAPEPQDDQTASDERPQPSIPKARLDKEIQKRRDLEAQLEEMKRMLQEIKEQRAQPDGEAAPENPEPAPPQIDYDQKILELEKQYMEQLFNGETDAALEVRAQINRLQEEKLRAEIQQEAKQTVDQTKEQERYLQEAERLQNEYPIFNPEAPEFNQEALNYALQLRDALVQSGKPIVDALLEATELARLKYNYTPKAPEPEAKVEPKPKPAPKKETLEKKLEAASKQPPKLTGEGEGDGEVLPDPTKMSIEEWEKLPEEVQNKLLGIV